MKGSSLSASLRVLLTFAAAFIFGAVVIFGLASMAGAMFSAAGLPLTWKLGLAGSGMFALAFVDILSIKQGGYCPFGLHRQTSRALMRQRKPATVAAVWGFDTGLAVTTFRVAALTWGALLMTGLGFSPWWIGLGYGVAFVLPLLILILTRAFHHQTNAQARFALTLEGMLKQRAVLQSTSAAALLITGTFFILKLLAE